MIKNTPQQQTVTPKKQEYRQKCRSQILNILQLLLVSHLKKLKKNDTAPADISQSAGGNPIHPRLQEYPKHSERKSHAWSFVSAWFDKYQWAEYSQDAMFCFPCTHFARPAYGNADDAFIKTGFL